MASSPILAIDGALGGFSAAVLTACSEPFYEKLDGNVALESGIGLIEAILERAAVQPAALGSLAVITGPGGFTGLRIAISYAKSLALGWGKPLCGVSSFEAIEFGCKALPRLGVIAGRPGIASVRLLMPDSELRTSGPISEVCDRIAAAKSGPLTVLGAPEDVLAALGERGLAVQTLPVAHPPAIAAAYVCALRAPAASAHAVRADYGEAPAAKVPQRR